MGTSGKIVEIKNTSIKEYGKSNVLISEQAGKSNLLANKLMLLALIKIAYVNRFSEENTLSFSISFDEIKEFIPEINNGSFYNALDKISTLLATRSIIRYLDNGKGKSIIPVFKRFDYLKGMIYGKFNDEINEYVLDLRSNFTKLPIKIMFSFKNDYSFRLYELLRSVCYTSGHQKKNVFSVPYKLSELKFKLGTIDIKDDSNEKAANFIKKGETDYDIIITGVKKQKHPDWHDFKRYVLDVAVNEINDTTDIQLSYDVKKTGKGGKASFITFNVKYSEFSQGEDVVNTQILPAIKPELPEEANRIFKESGLYNLLSEKERISIYNDADEDIDRLKRAIDVMRSQSKDINNVVAFLKTAIKEGWAPATKSKSGIIPEYKKFEQRDYNFEELEKQLLNS